MSAAEQITSTGTRVSYEDMANPRRYGTVTRIQADPFVRVAGCTIPVDPFVITWDDGRVSSSDCRQAGWRVEVGPHRHRFITEPARQARECIVCGCQQEKVSGRWQPRAPRAAAAVVYAGDPRGPEREVVSVETDSSGHHASLVCGHVANLTRHFTPPAPGELVRCLACREVA